MYLNLANGFPTPNSRSLNSPADEEAINDLSFLSCEGGSANKPSVICDCLRLKILLEITLTPYKTPIPVPTAIKGKFSFSLSQYVGGVTYSGRVGKLLPIGVNSGSIMVSFFAVSGIFKDSDTTGLDTTLSVFLISTFLLSNKSVKLSFEVCLSNAFW